MTWPRRSTPTSSWATSSPYSIRSAGAQGGDLFCFVGVLLQRSLCPAESSCCRDIDEVKNVAGVLP